MNGQTGGQYITTVFSDNIVYWPKRATCSGWTGTCSTFWILSANMYVTTVHPFICENVDQHGGFSDNVLRAGQPDTWLAKWLVLRCQPRNTGIVQHAAFCNVISKITFVYIKASLFPISCLNFKICIITHFSQLFFPYGIVGSGLSEEQIAQVDDKPMLQSAVRHAWC